jgi:hypothetical protein
MYEFHILKLYLDIRQLHKVRDMTLKFLEEGPFVSHTFIMILVLM